MQHLIDFLCGCMRVFNAFQCRSVSWYFVYVCVCMLLCVCFLNVSVAVSVCVCVYVCVMHILDSEIRRFFSRYIMYVSSEIGELTLERLAWLNVWVVSSLVAYLLLLFSNLYHIGITYIHTFILSFPFSRALNGSFLVLVGVVFFLLLGSFGCYCCKFYSLVMHTHA